MKAKKGNQAQYQELYNETWKRYKKEIEVYCEHYLNCDKYTAEDCTQEVFRRFWTALKNGSEIKNVGGWLFKAARSECLRYKEKYGRQRTISTDEHEPADDEDVIEKIIKQKYTDEELLHMVADTLNKEQAFLFAACFLENRKSEEVAKELGVSVERLYKKKCKLKKVLASKVKAVIDRVMKDL